MDNQGVLEYFEGDEVEMTEPDTSQALVGLCDGCYGTGFLYGEKRLADGTVIRGIVSRDTDNGKILSKCGCSGFLA
jgi:hypothetical protein